MRFNGIKKSYLTVIRGRNRPVMPDVSRELIGVPGMNGSYLGGTTVGIRRIVVPVFIQADNFSDLQKIKEDMAAWLFTEQPAPLIFEDEPDRTYYAVVDGTLNLNELVRWGDGYITFICPDPFKHGQEKSATGTSAVTVQNKGTAPTYPRVRVNVKKDTTYLAIGNGHDINMIGNYGDVDETPFVREERKFWDEMGTTVGWANTDSIEEGENTGVMKTDGYSFYTDDYGVGTRWHGPARKKSIGSTLQDFQVDALVRQIGSHGQVGSVEITLLDVNNRVICKMVLTKRSPNNQAVWARIRAGNEQDGHDIMDSRGDADWAWARFNGLIRIGRIGNYWYAYVARLEGGKYHTSLYKSWTDYQGISTAPVAQVQVQLWAHGTKPASTTQRIDDVKVFKINSEPDGVPYVALKDDVIEFDHVNDIYYRNGEEILVEKAFIANFFELESGVNSLVAEPEEAIENMEVEYTEKFR